MKFGPGTKSIPSRSLRLWLTAGLLSVFVLAAILSRPLQIHEKGIFETNPPSPYFHYPPKGPERGTVLVIHGLDASKETMNLLSLGLSDAGFNVYSMDLPGHGDSKVGFNAVLAARAVAAALDRLGADTIVVGHSMGGALLLDLANDRSFSKMVLLSPAPTAVDQIRAGRVLVLTGQFDLPAILEFVPQLSAPQIELQTIPLAEHSGTVLQPAPIRTVVSWLGGDSTTVRTGTRLVLLFVEIICAVLLACLWLHGNPIPAEPIHIPSRLFFYIGGSLAALAISSIVTFPDFGLYSTGYLVRFLLLLGIALLPLCFRKLEFQLSKTLGGLLAAAGVIAVAAYIGYPQLHLTLSSGRWWRFVAIGCAVLPLSLVDETILRPIRPWWKAAGTALLTRIVIAAFVITGVLTLNRDAAFLGLIIHFLVLLWMALWFAGELIRRKVQNRFATALCVAVIQAWVFAAMFVML